MENEIKNLKQLDEEVTQEAYKDFRDLIDSKGIEFFFLMPSKDKEGYHPIVGYILPGEEIPEAFNKKIPIHRPLIRQEKRRLLKERAKYARS